MSHASQPSTGVSARKAATEQRLGASRITVAAGIRPSGAAVAGTDHRRPVAPVASGADSIVVGRLIRTAAGRIVAEFESVLRGTR